MFKAHVLFIFFLSIYLTTSLQIEVEYDIHNDIINNNGKIYIPLHFINKNSIVQLNNFFVDKNLKIEINNLRLLEPSQNNSSHAHADEDEVSIGRGTFWLYILIIACK